MSQTGTTVDECSFKSVLHLARFEYPMSYELVLPNMPKVFLEEVMGNIRTTSQRLDKSVDKFVIVSFKVDWSPALATHTSPWDILPIFRALNRLANGEEYPADTVEFVRSGAVVPLRVCTENGSWMLVRWRTTWQFEWCTGDWESVLKNILALLALCVGKYVPRLVELEIRD